MTPATFPAPRQPGSADGTNPSPSTVPQSAQPPIPPPPSRFPDPPGYRLGDPLGTGGMGVVYAAEQLALCRRVAVKFLRPDGFARPDLVARFRTEAAALARTPHPNIVQVFEVGEAEGRPFLVLELVAGGNLAEKLAGGGPLAPRASAGLVRTLADAVAAAHAAGIVHRDLKPGNVLLTPAGEPKVTDFGLAKPLANAAGDTPLATAATRTGVVLGTPNYMAPEQAAGHPDAVGPGADVYALGVILYECLTGRVPFRAASIVETLNLVLTADPPAPRQLQPGVPRDLETVCLTCLRKDPARRYPSARALADDLGAFLAGRPIVARPTGPAERFAKWCRRQKALAALLFSGLAAAAAGAAGLAYHNARLQVALDEKTAEEAKARREKERADENYRQAREAVRKMIGRVRDRKYAEVPRAKELQRAQAEDALAYFRTVAGQRDDASPEVRYDAARADAEAGELYHALGDPGRAAEHYRTARDGFARLAAEFPADRRYRFDLGFTTLRLGAAEAAPFADTVRTLSEAVAVLRGVAADPAATDVETAGLASALNTLAATYHLAGKWAEAEPLFTEAYELRLALAPRRPPGDRELSRQLAENMLNLSAVYRMTGRMGPAAEFHDKCETLLQGLADADPDDRDAVCGLAVERVNWSYVLAGQGKAADSLDRLGRLLPALTRLHSLEPNDGRVRDALYRVHGARGQLFERLGRHAEAAAEAEQNVRLAVGGDKRYRGWFLARARVAAGDVVGAVRDAEGLLGQCGAGVPYAEPFHGAETCALAAGRLRAAAAVGSAGPAVAADRAEAVAVRLLGKVKAAATPPEWLAFGFELPQDPKFQPLTRRADYRALMTGK